MLFAGPYIPFDVMQLILVSLLIIGVISVFILDRFVCRIDLRKQKAVVKDIEATAAQTGSSVQLVRLARDGSSIATSSPAPTPPASPAPTLATAHVA